MNPYLSIIVPLYNAEENVSDLFSSISNQLEIDKSRIEILIINDGSSDLTEEYIASETHQLKLYGAVRTIKNAQNRGIAKTRLVGAEKAKGEFITFIDARTRPDPNYLKEMFSKERNIVVGNPYLIKTRSIWDRVLWLIRKKIYMPYAGYEFEDIELDQEAYRSFKNKGGGGALFVKRDYFLKVNEGLILGKHINDDSLIIDRLAAIEPVLKSCSPKTLYLNRTGFSENVAHLFLRGPKFVDYYFKTSSRYFPFFLLLFGLIVGNVFILLLSPHFFIIEFLLILGIHLVISLWISEEVRDIPYILLILPLALLSFSAGILYGLILHSGKKLSMMLSRP